MPKHSDVIEDKVKAELKLKDHNHSTLQSSSTTSFAIARGNHVSPYLSSANFNNIVKVEKDVLSTPQDNRCGGDIIGLTNVKTEEMGDILVVMGCQSCYLYCMVSKKKPRCPKCYSPNLLDISPMK